MAALTAAGQSAGRGEFIVELEVPGYEEKELEIEVSDHMLTVKGEHELATEETEKTYRLHERVEREFERRFELPTLVDTQKLTATVKRGVLGGQGSWQPGIGEYHDMQGNVPVAG